jgi:hypothetical protein
VEIRVRTARRTANRSSRRGLAAFASLLAALAAALTVVTAPPATAVPPDTNWTATGPGTVQTVSQGAASAPAMTYSLGNAGLSVEQTWTFEAVAAQAGTVTVPYTWQGLHAWFQVTTRLEKFTAATPTAEEVRTNLVAEGPTSCCDAPSNGFIYSGVVTFDVEAGQHYGFRLSGSNADANNFLRGTFTLSTKPYLDATIGTDNRDWTGAEPPDTTADLRSLEEAGEARWFKFPVVPGQNVTVRLTGLTRDYDLALYGDIQAAYDQLTGDGGTSSSGTSATTGVSDTQLAELPPEVATIPTALTSQTFAPRIYAPRIYAPRIYAPRIYAPRIYAPRIYAPRIYAPNSYLPDLFSDPAFQEAYSAAQNQTLLAVSTNAGTSSEEVHAASGNTNGYFYVRVQGHTDQAFAANTPFTVTAETSGSGCSTLDDKAGLTLMPAVGPGNVGDPTTVILTDTSRADYEHDGEGDQIGGAEYLLDELGALATAQHGVVVDVKNSPRVQALWGQATAQPDCPYAVNLVAAAVDQIVETLQGSATKYVVLAGGDDVIPFFRYPDLSGLGQESQFEPPMRDGTTSFGSLSRDQVLSQDAYGSDTNVTIAGASLPVPELAVGRLVKTDQEIGSTIENFLTGGSLITPSSSLVTGYDFLTDAANAVNAQFTEALGAGGTADTLISDNDDPDGDDYQWDADRLEQALLGGAHHDLVFLAGHFSANDAEAANFESALDASLLADPQYAGHLRNTLVLSAGCHSGYNIVDRDAVIGTDPEHPGTNTFDWTQRFAQQHALLIGGTGYQYGDTDFLEYSERLYLEIARRLHEATGGPIAVGNALVRAKQDYLSGLVAVSGIDQKALLQATLYGLPMTAVDAPGRTSLAPEGGNVTPTGTTREPGATLGLRVADRTYDTTSPRRTKSLVDGGTTYPLTWREGQDGVVVQTGLPALPKQIEDVSVQGATLRGIGFRGGAYTDTTGLLPLTGAPAIEGATPNTTFESEFFFPQSLTAANYFGTLGSSGRTSLIMTPAQYRLDTGVDPDVQLPTDTERAYSSMGVRLFYSGSGAAGGTAPVAPPAIGNVRGTYSDDDVTFSVRATGDPSAGVQQVWVTYTDAPDDQGRGSWESFDLEQDPNDSTRWTGTMPLGGRSPASFRFLVQAASGAGAVSLDTADGDGYGITLAADVALPTLRLDVTSADTGSPYGVTAVVADPGGSPLEDQVVAFTVTRGTNTHPLATYSGATDPSGEVVLNPTGTVPLGPLTVRADLVDGAGTVIRTETALVSVGDFTLVTGTEGLTTRAGTVFGADPLLTATLWDRSERVGDWPVTFTIEPAANGAGATFPDGGTSVTVLTDADGVASAPGPVTATSRAGAFTVSVSAEGALPSTLVWASQYGLGSFGPPVDGRPDAVNGGSGNLPLKFPVLATDGSAIPDAEAAGLVSRVQLRWRPRYTSDAWQATTELASYDASANTFQVNLKTKSLGMTKGTTYLVEVRILAAGGDPKPGGYDEVAGEFDLGRTSLLVKAEK